MLGHKYHIYKKAWGPKLGRNDAYIVGINAVAKRNPDLTYEAFNELVAARLGQFMGLPIPVGMLTEKGSDLYYVSCHIDAASGKLPEADLERFCEQMPRDACGTMVFDAWLGNDDRHDENLWYNYHKKVPEYFLIDHGCSLLGHLGEDDLRNKRDHLGVRWSNPALSEYLSDFATFPYWYEQILAIPDSAIQHTVRSVEVLLGEPGLANDVIDWLLERRRRLPDLFRNELSRFSAYKPSLIDPFGGYDDTAPEFSI